MLIMWHISPVYFDTWIKKKLSAVKPNSSYRAVVRVSMPLVISMTTTVVMTFTDRGFLANYSIDAIAAALPAGIAAFVFFTFFADTAGYTNVIIAQYTGAGKLQRVGRALWQGIYFSVVAWLIMVGLSFGGGPLFRMVDHAAEVQQLEVIYFRLLCLGSGLHIIGMSFSSFFTGRGVTRPVMIIYIIAMLINVPLDYALINGIWIFPRLGIEGAAIATVFSWTTATILLRKAAVPTCTSFATIARNPVACVVSILATKLLILFLFYF